jgi:hypothetical protein
MPGDATAGSRAGWIGVLVAVVGAAVYLPSLASGFNADDFLILWRIKSIEGLSEPLAYFKFAFYDYFRPLGFLSYALDWRLWGSNPLGFHLTNVVLHAANAALVFHLAGRLLTVRGATVAALLFALHPASHEAVYWVAARFDLLATFFVLVSLVCLAGDSRSWRSAGIVAFALALLSKESAISLLIIAPAWDALIDRRSLRDTVRRLIPLLIVLAAYAAARSFGADLAAAGGERRLPKLLMTGAALGGVLWLAWRREHSTGPREPISMRRQTMIAAAGSAASLFVPSSWVAEKIGFVTHVVFYSISPVVMPSPPTEWFSPESMVRALPHAVIILITISIVARWLRRPSPSRNVILFIAVFVAAALLPVSSMTGGLRYLYLSSVGVALAAGYLVEGLTPARRRLAVAVVGVLCLVSVQQVIQAGRAWHAASTMTRDGVLLMAGAVRGCGVDDVLLLDAPVAIGGVYANLPWDAFDVLTGCPPRSFNTLLRVMHHDVHATVRTPEPRVVELRVTDYAGNIVASRDLRNFGIVILPGQSAEIDTTVGRLEIFAEGTTQVFRLTMTGESAAAGRFYYSDGRIRQ